MERLKQIEARIVNKAGNPSGVSAGNMKIPGMKIGTQMTPGGPTFEDLVWLIEKVKAMKNFIRTATYEKDDDKHMALKIAEDVENGK